MIWWYVSGELKAIKKWVQRDRQTKQQVRKLSPVCIQPAETKTNGNNMNNMAGAKLKADRKRDCGDGGSGME